MAEPPPISLRFDDFLLDEAEARLLRAGQPVPLPPKALALLCTLARRPGQLVTKDAMLDATWGHRHVSESVLKSTISQLRAALGDNAKQPRYIETASRHGYRFIGAAAAPTAAPMATPMAASAASPAGMVAPVPAPAWPPIAAVLPRPAPIGRGATLERLQAAWAAAAGGQRRIVWLAGEAGVGKTTLIEHFSAQHGAAGAARIAHGQCVQQFGSGEPYMPVLEALAGLCREDPTLVDLLRAVAPTWLLQLPWLCEAGERAALQQQLAGVHPDRMLREGGELLDRYSQQVPLLMVTEDLHWSDRATVRLLEHVARRRGPARLLWLGSYRPAELVAEGHALKGLRHELRLQRLCEEIALDPFSELELADYLAQRSPQGAAAPPESLVRALHAHTDGLPLFVANVVDELLAAGSLGDAALRRASQVPPTLAGVLERQFERLAPDAQTLLEAASVQGVEFRPEVLAMVLQREPLAVRETCDELVRQGQWLRASSAGFEFRHALVRHAVYQRSGGAVRVRLHAHVAEALEDLSARGLPVAPAELASHCERGQRPMAALLHYAEATRAALGRFAPNEAAQLTERALALLPQLPEGPERLELELVLVSQRGIACSMLETFSAEPAKLAFERALVLCEQLPQTPQRAWVLNGLGWVLYSRADYAAARTLARHIASASSGPDAAALEIGACNLMGVTLAQQGDWVGARGWLERGLALCQSLGDALPLARFVVDPRVSLRSLLGLALLPLGETDAALRLNDEALALAEALGHPTPLLAAHWCAGMLAQRLMRPDIVQAHAEALARMSEELGLTAATGPSLWLRGWVRLHTPADAEPATRAGLAREAHALIVAGIECHHRSGRQAGLTHVMTCDAEALLAADEVDAAARRIDEALQLSRQIDEHASVAELLLLRGRIAALRGQAAAATADLDAALADARARQAVQIEALVQQARAGRAPGPDRTRTERRRR